jgi:hypothetical protein
MGMMSRSYDKEELANCATGLESNTIREQIEFL